MARLFYMSLEGVGDWPYVLRSAGAQLNPYRNYLFKAIKAAERRKPVLAWRPATAAEHREFERRRRERHEDQRARARTAKRRRDREAGPPEALPAGVWVVLEPPPWRPEEPDTTFDAFLKAREVHEDAKCPQNAALARLDGDREGLALLLPRLPATVTPPNKSEEPPSAARPYGDLLWLRPDTYQLQRQQQAVQHLENAPSPRLSPLVRLTSTRPTWPRFDTAVLADKDWVFLRTPRSGVALRDGTDEQRRFVSIALGTPDFAILEGPPGSGKTTAICELIAQLARAGKRVLLVASTHVAVDNVLERIIDWQDDPKNPEKLILPVRIGDEDNVSSERVRPWIFRRLVRTWRSELRDFLDDPQGTDPAADGARELLARALAAPGGDQDSPLVNLILDAANLVCGTTIGILQHPAIKSAGRDKGAVEPFDVMILDEASKTTFTEFLVPALYARKWIVVGDVRQLSPYVEAMDLAENIRALVPPEYARAAVLAGLAPPQGRARGPRGLRSLIAASREEAERIVEEARAREVLHLDLDHHDPRALIPALLYADLIVGQPTTIAVLADRLPVDLMYVSELVPTMASWEAAREAWLHRQRGRVDIPEEIDWADEITWRLIRSYELRQSEDERRRIDEGIEALMPRTLPPHVDKQGARRDPREHLRQLLDTTRRVALPSILELLQRGFERLGDQREGVALTDGLPRDVLTARLVSLSFQHRMHPEISAFPREQFYSRRALVADDHDDADPAEYVDYEDTPYLLRDAAPMHAERHWSYSRYKKRVVWSNTSPNQHRGRRPRGNVNPAEAERLLEELSHFVEWASSNPKPGGAPWDVAVLTFYRGQETLLRQELQRLSGLHGHTRNFRLPRRENKVHVTLCTVDRFQGHEADLVLLSFVKSGTVGFLNSPNRLNVALTRARYQLVLVGHQSYFADTQRCRSRLLNALATSPHIPVDLPYSQEPKPT